LDGREAERIGLVTRCVPDDQVVTEALAIAGKLAGRQPDRGPVDQADHEPVDAAAAPVFGESLALEMLGFLGPDAAEGLQAVRDRRPPEFPSAR